MPLGRKRKHELGDADVESTLANLHRLQAVDASGLLDKPADPELNALVKQAAAETGSTVSTITILDSKRQFFAAEVGRDGPRETDLDRSYCKYVVTGNDVFAIEDAAVDSLVMDTPAFVEDGLRSYLGVPIKVKGEVIGALCVANHTERAWTDDDLERLETLAEKAMNHISSR